MSWRAHITHEQAKDRIRRLGADGAGVIWTTRKRSGEYEDQPVRLDEHGDLVFPHPTDPRRSADVPPSAVLEYVSGPAPQD